MSPIIPSAVNAEIAAWRDPDAEVRNTEPSDPAEHACLYHDERMTIPITAEIISRQPVTRWACRPCAESIVAYLRGAASYRDVPYPRAALEAAQLSISLGRITGEFQMEATVTELRPRKESPGEPR